MVNSHEINLHSDIKAMEAYKRHLFDRKLDDGAVENPDQLLESMTGSEAWMVSSFKLGMERARAEGVILGMRYANREKVSLEGEDLAEMVQSWRMIALLDQAAGEHKEIGGQNG